MKSLLIAIAVIFLSLNLFAQVEETVTQHKRDSAFYASLSDSSSWKTVKVFYNEQPVKGNYKKPPVYHEFKVIGGIIYVASGNTDFSSAEKPFTFGQNLMPNVCIITNSTYHNFVYGFMNNTLKVVNGFPFGTHNLDVYIIPGVNLNSGIVCLSTGIEKKVQAGDVNFFMFAEVGKNLAPESKVTLSIGFHVNIQSVLIQHKGREIFYQK